MMGTKISLVGSRPPYIFMGSGAFQAWGNGSLWGIAMILLLLGGLMGGLRLYQRRCSPHPEWVRKLFHIGGGLIALTLPALFDQAWPVVFLSGAALLGLATVRYCKGLREGLGAVTHAVARDSWGELCFPLGVGLLFVLAQGDPLLYGIPLLILTWADSIAALVGLRYGLRRFPTLEGEKSVEGSVAFFVVAFLSTHIPLLLFTGIGRAESLLIALFLGALLMGVEILAWRGLDNLLIPLVGFLWLKTFLGMDGATLIAYLGIVGVVGLGLLGWWGYRMALNDRAFPGQGASSGQGTPPVPGALPEQGALPATRAGHNRPSAPARAPLPVSSPYLSSKEASHV